MFAAVWAVHHTVWMTTKSLVCVCRILKGGSKVVLMLVLLEVQSFCRLYYALGILPRSQDQSKLCLVLQSSSEVPVET